MSAALAPVPVLERASSPPWRAAPRRGEAGGVVQQIEHRPIHVRPAQGAGLGGGAVLDEVQSPGGAQIPAGGR